MSGTQAMVDEFFSKTDNYFCLGSARRVSLSVHCFVINAVDGVGLEWRREFPSVDRASMPNRYECFALLKE